MQDITVGENTVCVSSLFNLFLRYCCIWWQQSPTLMGSNLQPPVQEHEWIINQVFHRGETSRVSWGNKWFIKALLLSHGRVYSVTGAASIRDNEQRRSRRQIRLKNCDVATPSVGVREAWCFHNSSSSGAGYEWARACFNRYTKHSRAVWASVSASRQRLRWTFVSGKSSFSFV